VLSICQSTFAVRKCKLQYAEAIVMRKERYRWMSWTGWTLWMFNRQRRKIMACQEYLESICTEQLLVLMPLLKRRFDVQVEEPRNILLLRIILQLVSS
jgi:hypothetical protein